MNSHIVERALWALAGVVLIGWMWLCLQPQPGLTAAYLETAPAYMEMARTGVYTRFNLNTATPEQLQTIDGIGEVLSTRICSYIEENGPIRDYEELLAVPGVGEQRLEEIQKHTTLR
jgi:competence ComEA-like helix-hairpin-helix protein